MNQDHENRPGGETQTGAESLEELLSDPHIRCVLAYLNEVDESVSLARLATHVSADVTDSRPEDVPDDVRDRVQTFLHHGHLPELARHGIVDYDQEANRVSLAN
jgi:hypothetical protein